MIWDMLKFNKHMGYFIGVVRQLCAFFYNYSYSHSFIIILMRIQILDANKVENDLLK